jgi:hypothetical protein
MSDLLKGKPYVPSWDTNIRKTFARIRRELRQAKPQPEAKVLPIKKKGKA